MHNKISGAGSVFLAICHCEAITQDPFSVLKTQEIEEFADDSILLRSS
jgi:hypothetical protein